MKASKAASSGISRRIVHSASITCASIIAVNCWDSSYHARMRCAAANAAGLGSVLGVSL